MINTKTINFGVPLKQKLFTILTMTCCLIILSCGDDNDGDPNQNPGGQVGPASTMMNAGVVAAFAQTQSTSVLGGYPDAINVVAADNGCSFLPDHLSNIYYYGVIDHVWNSACFDPVNREAKSMPTRDYVKRLLDPSVANIAENGPNVLNSLEAKLLIPCILSLVLPIDKYDDNRLPEPREEPYNFTITQEIIDSAKQNCGGPARLATGHFGPAGSYTGLKRFPFGGFGVDDFTNAPLGISRGGHWYQGVESGVFAVSTNEGLDTRKETLGFRCVYHP
jgi:hypothetical protein